MMADREALYRAVIGPKNQAYYLTRFERFDETDKVGVTWHWPAALLTFFWLIYRRMWAVAFAYLVAANLMAWVLGMIFGTAAPFIALILQITLPGMFATCLYHAHCNQKIAEVVAETTDVSRQLGMLEASGGTSRAGALVAFALLLLLLLGILAAIAIPQYQTYVNRAKVAEAAELGKRAVQAVELYRQQHGELPAKLVEARFIPTPPPFVFGIEMDGVDVVVTIRQGAGFPDGGRLVWSTDGSPGLSSWRCRAQRLPPAMVPQDCR